MKRVAFVIVCAAIALAAIAAFAPASLVDARLAAATGGTARVADAQGTLWRGRGVVASADGRWRIPVAWTLSPLALLRGTTLVDLSMADGAAHGVQTRLEMDDGRIAANSLVARVPASTGVTIPGASAFAFGGDLELRSDALTLAIGPRAPGGSGAVAAQWRDARIVAPGWPAIDLGTVVARLDVQGHALAGPVSSTGGTIVAGGELAIGADRLVADLRLRPEASASPAVKELLQRLGPVDAAGAVSLRVERSLR